MSEKDIMPFDYEKATKKQIIKVIGVGGGGGNAVKNMFREGIHDVAFALCNTDAQALAESEIPTKVQLGRSGLGAGNNPPKATEEAEESIESIRALFSDETKMVFITAGMGGGTGTGASPVIAREAQAAGMLTVGVVTIPFRFEQRPKIMQALKGVDAIATHVDALLVINNERLFKVYPDMDVNTGFAKANEILTVAVKSIAELITVRGTINLDFRDVEKVLKNGGVAVMSYGFGKGEHRLTAAINEALHSPLLNDNDVYNSKKILFNIYQSKNRPLLMSEMEELDQFMDEFRNKDIEVIWGIADDESLDENVKITILATGFGISNIPGMEKGLGHPSPTPRQEEPILPQKEAASPATSAATQDEDRIIGTYGEAFSTFVFDEKDLDNDDLIAAVANSPTYNRKATDLKNLQGMRTSN
ncbi:MAG: cell division protein FtsZ [Bacteroidaceae bacterium]|nr:cell division protein FtsZ [Bacteroidaceae bacterium]MBR4336819.1 cell division protein FtsZ [Bacteroidaceae bacterium]